MKKVNKSDIFKAAHKRTRYFQKVNRKHNYSYSVMFSFFLKSEYERANKEEKEIKIIKETEKAVFVSVNVKYSFKSEFTNTEMWIPKSVIKNSKVSNWFIEKSSYYAINL